MTRRTLRGSLWLYVPMGLLAIFFLFPIVFMLVSSLKADDQIFADLTSGGLAAFLPTSPVTLDNYAEVFRKVPVGRFLVNSLIVSLITVAFGLVVNSMAGFALSRMRFRGQTLVLGLIVATLIVPFDSIAIPLLFEVAKLPGVRFEGLVPTFGTSWLDTYYVQIIPFIANAFSIFLFRQFFLAIPRELDEAAKVDGAGWFTIYRRIAAPLAGPAFATVAILTFLPAWNQYLWPLLITTDRNLTPIVVGVTQMISRSGDAATAWNLVMATVVLAMIPPAVIVVLMQRWFVKGLIETEK